MNPLLHVLIIEDDFRVAGINQELVEQLDGYRVAFIAKTGDEAIDYLKHAETLPDLILLDVFIPDRTGLDLFWEIRGCFPKVAVIMLTAAREAATIAETIRGGAFDYLIKPVDFDRFALSLQRLSSQRLALASQREWTQQEIDQLLGILPSPAQKNDSEAGGLPKGIDQLTLDGVREFLMAADADGINAMEAGQAVGISRSTARRYLEHLVSIDEAKAQLNYGEIGRPERRYVPWTK